MSDYGVIAQLAQACGIQPAYHDIWGNERRTSPEVARALLSGMGLSVGSDDAVAAALAERLDRPFLDMLPPVCVVRQSRRALVVPVSLPEAGATQVLSWEVSLEQGAGQRGERAVATLRELSRREVGGVTLVRRELVLELDLPLGYHELSVSADGKAASTRLIVAPDRCFVPAALREGERVFGAAVQLYGLRTATDMGAGDFGALLELTAGLASQGAAFVGVNPLHAAFPHAPAQCSPYSPSSRLFLNLVYADVCAIPDFAECAEARELVGSAEFAERWRAAREATLVDYPAVMALKRPVFELLYAHFRAKHLSNHKDERAREFRAFVRDGGEALYSHALYEALQEMLFARDPSAWGWPVWPAEYRDPSSPAVRAVAEAQRERVEFFLYVQWVLEGQLLRVTEVSRASGMAVGLYLDLAVGVDRGGSEAWGWQSLFGQGVSVGAPPDELALKGQDWGLPPWIPERLERAAYEPFIATLRHNMRRAGALRIDHVMALRRLFWVPAGLDATAGAYVTYPFEDLLAVLALESQRNQCLVIGEDLGTVPPEVRAALAAHDVLSYRVGMFENDERNHPKAPSHYPSCALVTFSTHDLPTLPGFWQGRDLSLRTELDLFPSQEVKDRLVWGRGHQRWALLQALLAQGLLPDPARTEPAQWPELTPELTRALYAYFARTPCWLLAVQLEDVLGVSEQPNLPGTVDEHPNWRRRLPAQVAEVVAGERLAALFSVLAQERRGGGT